jgi:hypothetical protein
MQNSAQQRLKTGIAYHGNRILKHVEEDMRDCIAHHINLVVHMLSHNDWDRHRHIMREIVALTEGLGLEVWLDNWGLGGPPGDKSHFLAYYPGSHQIYNTGEMDPVRACLNSPDFRRFTRDWIDLVVEVGGKTILWDEPHLVGMDIREGKPMVWSCRCETCQALFREQYGHAMPSAFDDEVAEFRLWTVVDYFTHVTGYSATKGLTNAVVVMLGAGHGINLSTIERVARIPTMDNVGSDPYWFGGRSDDPYGYVYGATRQMLEVCQAYGKGHNLWIQGFGVPRGREEEIVLATDAAYDAGARTILAWGYRGSESNDYRAECPELTWQLIGDAMARIQNREWDRLREERRAALAK